jgi:hypothetical protein
LFFTNARRVGENIRPLVAEAKPMVVALDLGGVHAPIPASRFDSALRAHRGHPTWLSLGSVQPLGNPVERGTTPS